MREFANADAAAARAQSPVPLMIGCTGPSGSGKTYSALLMAKGIQTVYGGDIFCVDTEQRRSLHYADKIAFKHVDFQAPYSSLDYLEALRYCKKQGAGSVIIDSGSHEHDGPGGLLEQHEAELDRLAGNDYAKRDRLSILAWAKPKAARRKLITAITTELAMPVIFCFRAKTGTKPAPKGGQDRNPIEMGFTSIGADEWLFELGLNLLFLPGSDGVPTWHSDKPGERLAIKCPLQFRWLQERGNRPIDEAVGVRLAEWAHGTPTVTKPAHGAEKPRFEATDAGPDYAATLDRRIANEIDPTVLGKFINSELKTDAWATLRENDPARAAAIKAKARERVETLKAELVSA